MGRSESKESLKIDFNFPFLIFFSNGNDREYKYNTSDGIPYGTCNCAGEGNEIVCGSIYKDCWDDCKCFNDEDGDLICDEDDFQASIFECEESINLSDLELKINLPELIKS